MMDNDSEILVSAKELMVDGARFREVCQAFNERLIKCGWWIFEYNGIWKLYEANGSGEFNYTTYTEAFTDGLSKLMVFYVTPMINYNPPPPMKFKLEDLNDAAKERLNNG